MLVSCEPLHAADQCHYKCIKSHHASACCMADRLLQHQPGNSTCLVSSASDGVACRASLASGPLLAGVASSWALGSYTDAKPCASRDCSAVELAALSCSTCVDAGRMV